MTANMTSRERVVAAFSHAEPDRVPAWLGASPEFRELARQRLGLPDDESLSVRLGDDFRRVSARYAGPPHADPYHNLAPGATYRTPFGVERHGPQLRRLIDLGHAYGLKVLMHCCGGFRPLMPAMIEAGLDGLQALQPSCRDMEPARLKRLFGEKLVFAGCIDTQQVLIEGTPDLVRQKTREVLEAMMPGGGYIASPSHDFVLPETPVDNVVALYDTVQAFGFYTH